jgi:hypothetical protein
MAITDEKKVDAQTLDAEKGEDLSPKDTIQQGETIILKHADPNDGDEALNAFVGHEGEAVVITPEMEKKLLWKIDRNIMPVRPAFTTQTEDLTYQYLIALMCCVLHELPRQDDPFIRLSYGNSDLPSSRGRQLPVAGQYVLHWLHRLGIPNEPAPATAASGKVVCL